MSCIRQVQFKQEKPDYAGFMGYMTIDAIRRLADEAK